MIPLSQNFHKTIHDKKTATFDFEELYPGYGITLGNALRRVLLSSIPGAAITSVSIKGTSHEFSTIPGVLEDVLELTLNLKGVRLILHGDEPQMVHLKVKGPKTVIAGDIECPSQVEIVNKDAEIATITGKGTTLELDMEVGRGMGYESVAGRKREKSEIGTLQLDAIFSPVRKVNFLVENMRVGDRTDYNRLKIDLETDGSITPDAAMEMAVQILIDQFTSLLQVVGGEEIRPTEMKTKEATSASTESDQEELLKLPLEELDLSTRTINVLQEGGIKSLAGLVRKKEDDLMNLEGMGDKGIEEIKKALKKKKLSLKE